MSEQPALDFGGLLRQLRGKAGLTQEELAEAAGLSPRAVSDLERGTHRTARKDTALLLADALLMAGPARELFVAAARGRAPAASVLAARSGPPGAGGGVTGRPGGFGGVTGSPYRGLKAFGELDAALFFGREAATAQLLERMSRLAGAAGVLVVSGVSGAGKSSLLHAGVLPQIRAAGLVGAPQAASWPCLVFTPTRAPLDELALRVAAPAGTDAAAVRRGLDTDPAGFALTARQAALAAPPGQAQGIEGFGERDQLRQRRLLLVVDQFEELFTQCAVEAQRRAFITALHAAATTGHGPEHTPAVLAVLGVRADFEAHCADYPQLAGAIQDRYLVTSMTERQLRMAITEPAKKAGGAVDDDLVAALLAEVRAGQPGIFAAGVLPLLSHALDQAWRSRSGETLTLADYERTGGIEGAVAASAQRAYDALTPAQKATARQVFTRLAATSSEGIDCADRATRADLTTGKTPAETADVERVLEAFAAERLLTLAAGTVELSHEVLLTAWPLLRDTWLADTHADRIVRTRLQHTATEWDHHARDPSYLYTGSLLQAATGTAARITADPIRHPPLSQTECDFLRASDRAHHRGARRRQAVIAGLLALTLAAVTAAGIAARNAASASRQHAIALSRQLAAESLSVNPTQPVIARRLAVAAWRVFPTSQAGSAMGTMLAGQQQNGILPVDPSAVLGTAFSSGGKLLASANSDGTVRLWNPSTGQPVGPPIPVDPAAAMRGYVFAVAFSPDGKLLATAGGDGTVRLWNPSTGQPVHVLHAAGGIQCESGGSCTAYGGVSGVAFSPDGKLLASADGDGTVRLWNPSTGRPVGAPLYTGSDLGVSGVAFSPDGKLLASASGDGTVRLWNPSTGQPVHVLPAASKALGVSGVAFSPDGKLLASADGDGTVRLWNPSTGQPVHVLPAASKALGGVRGVAFSPDGKLLASADGDGTVRLWNPSTGRPVGAPLNADISAQAGGVSVSGVAFSPDGKLLASADGDGTVRLWNTATDQPAGGTLSGTALYNVPDLAYSPDGRLLAGADSDGIVVLWNPSTRQPVRVLHVVSFLTTGVQGVAFSPDGKLLATAGGNGPVRLWNPLTGRPVSAPLGTTNAQVFGVAFSPGGKLLASAGADGTVRLWNPSTGQLVRVLHPSGTNGAFAVAFSPDGKLLAAAGADGTVLWNPSTGQPVRVLHTASGLYTGAQLMAFSPDGKLLASAESNGTVGLWNLLTGQPVGTPIPVDPAAGPGGGVSAVAFSPNGQMLASADSRGDVQIWKISAFLTPYAALCSDVGEPTRQEWKQYAAGEPQPRVC